VTPQQQADLILQGWQQHRADTEDLMTKLAQDREALLKAAKIALYAVVGAGWSNSQGGTIDALTRAISQAESK